jgi:DNA-binding transcriptional LysR family regulator
MTDVHGLTAADVLQVQSDSIELARNAFQRGRPLMQDHPIEGIEVALPRLLRDGALRGCVPCLPAHADTRRTEIDVFGVALVGTPAYWSDRDDWTLAMVAAGLGFALLPANSAKHPGIVALPIIEPEFWRQVKVSVRGHPHSPAVGALVRSKRWFGKQALATRIATQ